jgi:hypothetical protein
MRPIVPFLGQFRLAMQFDAIFKAENPKNRRKICLSSSLF